MTDTDTFNADYKALNELIVNCPYFSELETKLGDFNVFQVLRSEFAELKHSNVLAWLLDPSESHGLDAVFLQKWLMRALHGAASHNRTPVTPIEIDAWELRSVEIRREWNNIDILLILNMAEGGTWIVCIENKVNADQSPGQLAKYRKIVEKEFSLAVHRMYFFLTKNNEAPEDEAYLPTSYAAVHLALTDAVSHRRLSIGQEPRVLIDNYIRLLEEKFMNESDIARLALTIYKKHRRAIDVIFAHRPGNSRGMVLTQLAKLLAEHANKLGIVPGPSDKQYVRFIPKDWDKPGNHDGKGWSKLNSDYGVLFEIDFFKEIPNFLIVAGKPPSPWINKVNQICKEKNFKKLKGQKIDGKFPRLYSETIEAIDDPMIYSDPDEAAKAIYGWIETRLNSEDLRNVIEIIASKLPEWNNSSDTSA